LLAPPAAAGCTVPTPCNYLRFAPADVTPEAACLDAQGSIDIGRTEVMF
jgi:hypothetical protein